MGAGPEPEVIPLINDNLSLLLLLLVILNGALAVFSIMRDRRRFRNAVFLLFFVLFSLVFVIHYLNLTDHEIGALALFGLVTLSIVILVPTVLILNGVVMWRKEGRSLQNQLSWIFGVLIITGALFLMRSFYHADAVDDLPWMVRILMGLYGGGVFYVSLVFLAFMFYTWLIRVIPHRKHYDYVVVLGAGLLGGDRVSKLLADRLDKGVEVYRKNRPDCAMICSGGQGPDETVPEAEAMKGYLVSKGIPEDHILTEDRSTTTMENLTFSRKLIDSRDGGKKIAVVTSDYHVLRPMIYSRKIGMKVDGIGGHTALYYWPSAMIREYAALVKHYLVPYLFGLAIMLAMQFYFMWIIVP